MISNLEKKAEREAAEKEEAERAKRERAENGEEDDADNAPNFGGSAAAVQEPGTSTTVKANNPFAISAEK